jgi:hypothetical protein
MYQQVFVPAHCKNGNDILAYCLKCVKEIEEQINGASSKIDFAKVDVFDNPVGF